MTDEQDVTRKIAALLSKAENTDNEHEAEAFFAKATELMLRYSIDEARARAAGTRPVEKIVRDGIDFNWDYAPGKVQLIVAIAASQYVQVTMVPQWERTKRRCGLFGYERDVENVRMLYNSLIIQAIAAGSRSYRERSRYEGKTAFMTSFILGFAGEVGRRFREQAGNIRVEDPSGMALVDTRGSTIETAFKEAFPHLRAGRSSRTGNGSGYGAGALAGRTADIGNPGVAGGSHARLGTGR